jgi:DNA-binding Xre family transcriptional regulator
MPKEIIQDYGYQVTQRFLFAVDRILGNRANGKITQQRLGDSIGINSSNINRLRSDPDRKVTLEACCRLCDQFKVSTFWLLLGQGDMYSNDELMTAYMNLELKFDDLEKAVAAIEKTLEIIRKSKR